MKELTATHIASCLASSALSQTLTVSPYVVPEEGYAVAVRALADKSTYNQLECVEGDLHTLRKGDIIVGVLGERKALKGYSGRLPQFIAAGDVLHILNMGGIIGECTSDHPSLGAALPVEVLGAVVQTNGDGTVRHVRLKDQALAPCHHLEQSAPLVVVSGTSMNTGKTQAACTLIEGLTHRGLRVAAAKLTGAALKRDARAMEAHGAVAIASFTDTGIVSSVGKEMAPYAKALITHLNAAQPDVIVLEMGDGFIGYYGVDELLQDREIQQHTAAHVVTAADLAGTWAADHRFRTTYRMPIAVVTGPVTDNEVGRQYVQNALGIAAHNALHAPEALVSTVAGALAAPAGSGASRPVSPHRAALSAPRLHARLSA